MKKLLLLLSILFFALFVQAQSVGIGTLTPDASAMLDITSGNKGLLVPRMDKVARNAIASPVQGLLVFQKAPDSIGFYYYNSGSWVWLQNASGAGSGWSTTGNAGTNPATNGIGTTDNQPLKFIQGGSQAGLLDSVNNNYFIGTGSGSSMLPGSTGNVAFGYNALKSNKSGFQNVGIGNLALSNDTAGFGNVAIGNEAMAATLDAHHANTAIGLGALHDNKESFNTAVGFLSQYNNTIGYSNTSVGTYSLENNKRGINNTAMGIFALNADTSSSEIVAIGSQALRYNNNKGGNTAIGANALLNNSNTTNILPTEGLNNTALGNSALQNNKRGSGGVALGYKAAYSDTAADGIVAIGRNALGNNNGRYGNLAIGDSALFNNGLGVTQNFHSSYNLAIGSKALKNNTVGFENIAIGYNVLLNNISGAENCSVGNGSLIELKQGFFNTALGNASFYVLKNGSYNIGIGGTSFSIQKGSKNTIIGSSLNSYDPFVTDSIVENVIVGYHSLPRIKKDKNVLIGNNTGGNFIYGNSNAALGDSALFQNNAGENNVALGAMAGGSNGGNANVYIGYKAGFNAQSSNKLYIANSEYDSIKALIYGDFAADSLMLNAKTIVRNKLALKGNTSNSGIELGYDQVKEINAGRIGYGLFTPNTVDFIGGGTAFGNRTIKFWAENASIFTGKIIPDADNFHSLGISTNRWKDVWAANGVIQTSDANLKTNIVGSPYGLQQVMAMQPVQYNWKTTPNGDKNLGFLAQDIQKIIPEAVVDTKDGNALGMKYAELIPVLVKAIQEQQAKIEMLEAAIKKIKQ